MANETRLIGDEFDAGLRDRLMLVLRELEAETITSTWGVGGSQELESLEVKIDGQRVLIEAETYIGLSITGDSALIQKIAGKLLL